MNDTIYRQQAIKAFDDAGFCTHGYIVDVLDGLPSAQPERYWIDSEGKISTLPSGKFATDINVGDTVSRLEAIDTLTRLEPSFRGSVLEQALKNMPSAQPEWIPCSERLPEHPENDDYYLVTIQCEHYDGWDDYVTGFAEWTKHGWDELSCYIGQIKVIAWMPLPKPYGGESE